MNYLEKKMMMEVQKDDDRTAETENMPNSLFQVSSNYFGECLNHEEELVELNRYNEAVNKLANSENADVKVDGWKKQFEKNEIKFIGASMVKILASFNTFKLINFQSRFLTNLAKNKSVKKNREELKKQESDNNLLQNQNDNYMDDKDRKEIDQDSINQLSINKDIEYYLLQIQMPSKLEFQIEDDDFFIKLNRNEKLIKIKQEKLKIWSILILCYGLISK